MEGTTKHLAKLPIPTSEQLAPGHKSEWKLWKSLNRLRTGMGRSKTNLSKWGYADAADTACECGTSEQTMQHQSCWDAHFLKMNAAWKIWQLLNEKALHCARAWPNIWLNSGMMDTKEEDQSYGTIIRVIIMTYLQSHQISMKFILQVVSAIRRILWKF